MEQHRHGRATPERLNFCIRDLDPRLARDVVVPISYEAILEAVDRVTREQAKQDRAASFLGARLAERRKEGYPRPATRGGGIGPDGPCSSEEGESKEQS